MNERNLGRGRPTSEDCRRRWQRQVSEVRTEEGYDDDHELGRDARIRLHRGSGSERRHGFARKEDGDKLRGTVAWLLGAEGGVIRYCVGAAREVRVRRRLLRWRGRVKVGPPEGRRIIVLLCRSMCIYAAVTVIREDEI